MSLVDVDPMKRNAVPKPEGKLTPVQFEIMQLIWNAPQGLTVGELWEAIRPIRDVSRNTVLNLVDRLEKRAWLKRRKDQGVFRYAAAIGRQPVEAQLTADFVEEFFEGSAANLLMSLLGSQRLSKADIERLKRLMNQNTKGSVPDDGDTQ